MNDLAEQVLALYATLGKWRLVAKACNWRRMRHSPGYYQQISTGRIKNPPDNVIAGIAYAPQLAEQILSASQRRDTRRTVHIYPEEQIAGNMERNELGLTWPDMLRLWYQAYAKSIRNEARKQILGKE